MKLNEVGKLSFEEEAFAFVAVVLGGRGVFRTGLTSREDRQIRSESAVASGRHSTDSRQEKP